MRRLSLLMALSLVACVDTSAVTKFSQSAPDPAKLAVLTEEYVNLPNENLEWNFYGQSNDWAADYANRQQQKQAINDLHAVIVGYMKALGGLSDSKLIDVSAPSKSITDGLTSLMKADPGLGLTATNISAIGAVAKFVGDAVLNVWRERELARILEQNDAGFQASIAVERLIVKNSLLPGIENRRHFIQSMVDRLGKGLGGQGDATRIADRFLIAQAVRQEQARLDTIAKAAQAYDDALDKLSAAHTKLVESRNNLSEQTLKDITPFLKEAVAAYTALNKL